MDIMLEQWSDLCAELGRSNGVEEWYSSISGPYSAPSRAYHNLEHIDHCLLEFAKAMDLPNNPEAVHLAIWFHDIVYNPRAPRNEEESANVARRLLGEMGLKKKLIDLVTRLILVTDHKTEPKTMDEKVIADIDLSILGQPPSVFDAYEEAIRKEYSHVSDIGFRNGRAKVLKTFLYRAGGLIYHTPWFGRKYEWLARHNLGRSIEKLSGRKQPSAKR